MRLRVDTVVSLLAVVMGSCVSSSKASPDELKARREEKIRSKWIDESIGKEKRKDREAIKLLFLGAGESGKSTLLKQMTILHGSGFNKEDRKGYLPLIHVNIVQSMKALLSSSLEFAPTTPECKVSSKLEDAAKMAGDMRFDDPLTEKAVDAIKALWEDPGIQHTYDLRSKFQLSDSAKYFLDKASLVTQPNYEPTEQDILRARIRTTGIVEHRFNIDGNDFRMYDVGGQRNARKKWIHCFEKVTSVIFVAAISAYDQVIYEDNKTNSLHEALNLFEDICDSRYFVKTSIILFLNKKDIFKDKILVENVPLTECFPEYNGPNEFVPAVRFIKNEFKARNKQPEKRIYTHLTCATDTRNIRRVFESVKTIILRAHLVDVGLMDPSTELYEGNKPNEASDDEIADEEEDDSPSKNAQPMQG